MPLELQTTDIRGQLVFLGTGTSVGVPCIGCGCPTCTSENPKNKRTRCALVLGLPEGNLLIDTPPDLRTQLLREKIGIVHSVLYTHDHADHVFGLDDLRLFPHYLGHPLPVYCEDFVEARIRKSFDYAFAEDNRGYAGGVPQLDLRRITTEPFTLLGQRFIPDSPHARQIPRAGFPLRQHRLLHRHQRHLAGKLAAVGRIGCADSRCTPSAAACFALQFRTSRRSCPPPAAEAHIFTHMCARAGARSDECSIASWDGVGT